MALSKNALAFTMLMDGMPIIYYGHEQHFSGYWEPSNRQPLWTSGYDTRAPLYQYTAKLNKIRSHIIANDASFVPFQADPVYNTTNILVMKKGDVVSVLTSVGLGGATSEFRLPASATQYVADSKYVDLISCETFTAFSNGTLAFQMGEDPRVFFPASKLKDTDICKDKPKPGE